ncbi:MAG: hypothetical protein IKO15_02410 [Clostridiales bacterium]|nr:hypothetical protein [Clostridiales bacterium]
MILMNSYIPREYLALKINYCHQQLKQLPVVKVYRFRTGESENKRVVINNHKYDSRFEPGKEYYDIWKQRDQLERELRIYEAIWYAYFEGEPPEDCEPHKANRVIYVDTNKPVIMNKDYFDSLKNDADTTYAKPDNYKFNGIKYRSAAEKEIAIFYTEMGIPFKYEPEIFIKGMVKPIHPDFVLYLRELDTCKIHEHLGMRDYADYIKNTKIKLSNFIGAGLVQDLDVLFTYSTDDTHFDPRHLSAKLNSAIYGTICMNKPKPFTFLS